jgi:hypothetical protein
VYQDKSGGTTQSSEYFVCKGVRYTDTGFSPDWTFGFGSTDITAEQYVYMTTSGTCSDTETFHAYFTIQQ